MKGTLRRPARTAIALVAVFCWMAFSPGQALAAQVGCGDVITEDTTLSGDLVNCQDGIIVGADNVTLNLGGHTIGGAGVGATPFVFHAGVTNTGHDNVRIVNGTVRQFDTGVRLGLPATPGPSANVLSGLTLTGNGDGVEQVSGQGTTIEKSSVFGNVDVGIRLFGFDNVVEKNTLGDNPDAGVSERGARNLVEQNSVRGGTVGILVLGQAGRFEKNSVSAATEDGISVQSFADRAVLNKNATKQNGDDGIDVESATTTLTKNTANANGDLGIESVTGVAAAKNKARDNGNPLQCVNVFCK
jgi:hypothetical protein